MRADGGFFFVSLRVEGSMFIFLFICRWRIEYLFLCVYPLVYDYIKIFMFLSLYKCYVSAWVCACR